MKLSAYAKQIGVSYLTAYKYFQQGIIKGVQLPTGTILIDETQTKSVIPVKKEPNLPTQTKAILYARVSSNENKDNLLSQLTRIREYSIAKGYSIVKEVSEIGSGINSNRRKLLSIIKNKNYDVIVVEHKDRFARFGIEIIEALLFQLGKRIEIINTVEPGKEDIIQDLVNIITSFSARIYGRRRVDRKTEEVIKNLKNYTIR